MISINQLLESVDLDFEPRWVTKDEDGSIWIWNAKPDRLENWHLKPDVANSFYGRFVSERLKLSEFDGKDWTECIYEVPRKTTGKIEKMLEQKLTIGKTKYEYPTHTMLMDKINEIIDWINENYKDTK